ncbi:hypothetical protein [Bradyrhizobium manausense]|nr:hypothetical protein [Bradyrhizobium manausense]
MNNDSWSPADFARQLPADMSAQTPLSCPSPNQADFDQQLSELRSAHHSDSANLERESPANVTNSNTPPRTILQSERCTAAVFVRGRAELAASLVGASVEALSNEIGLAERRTAQWPTTAESSAGSVDGRDILNDVLASSYSQLHRFQNKRNHCKPRMDVDVAAMEHVRSMADLRCHTRAHVAKAFCNDDIDEIDMARMAAMHAYGYAKLSSFVSLAQDPSQLLVSDGDARAKAIAQRAKELHTYTVPKVAAWSTSRIDGVLARGSDPEDSKLREWVNGIPTKETEVLFLGGNLEDYRTGSQPNPYRIYRPGTNQEAQSRRYPPLSECASALLGAGQ